MWLVILNLILPVNFFFIHSEEANGIIKKNVMLLFFRQPSRANSYSVHSRKAFDTNGKAVYNAECQYSQS